MRVVAAATVARPRRAAERVRRSLRAARGSIGDKKRGAALTPNAQRHTRLGRREARGVPGAASGRSFDRCGVASVVVAKRGGKCTLIRTPQRRTSLRAIARDARVCVRRRRGAAVGARTHHSPGSATSGAGSSARGGSDRTRRGGGGGRREGKLEGIGRQCKAMQCNARQCKAMQRKAM